jgi:hypothetical protein
MIRIIITALAIAFATQAQALPCLGKLERGAASYRVVDGVKCWYVGERVPSKSEFSKPKRKEVVRSESRRRVVSSSTDSAPPAEATTAQAEPPQAEDAWMAAERPAILFEALCGDRCDELNGKDAGQAPTPAERVADAFKHLTVTPERVSWLYVKREEVTP